jgi:hypothetical protein
LEIYFVTLPTSFFKFSNPDFPGLAEARRLKQATERKSDGALKAAALEQTVKLFQNAMSMPLSPPAQEEALFVLVRVHTTTMLKYTMGNWRYMWGCRYWDSNM